MFASRKAVSDLWTFIAQQKLEIESLKLHVKELRKGLQDQSKEIDKLHTENKWLQDRVTFLANKAGSEPLFSVPIQGIPTSAPVIKSMYSRSVTDIFNESQGARQGVSLSDLVKAIANVLKIEWKSGSEGQLLSGKKAK